MATETRTLFRVNQEPIPLAPELAQPEEPLLAPQLARLEVQWA
jgi:hypothetical protein